MIWGLATLDWQAGEGPMRGALEAAAVRVAPTMNPQAVANTIWGLATLGWQVEERAMRGALEAAAVLVAPSMKPQNVANTIWGLATLGWQAGSELGAVFQHLVDAFAHEHGPAQLSTAHLSQLFQAHLASQFLGLGLITLPSSMLEEAVKTYREEARKVTVSNGQREVGESLTRCADWTYHMSSSASQQTGCSASILRSWTGASHSSSTGRRT